MQVETEDCRCAITSNSDIVNSESIHIMGFLWILYGPQSPRPHGDWTPVRPHKVSLRWVIIVATARDLSAFALLTMEWPTRYTCYVCSNSPHLPLLAVPAMPPI